MAHDPREERIEIAPRLMGRDSVPRFHIGITFAFLRGLPVTNDPMRQRAQAAAVFLRCVPDRVFVAPQVQINDLIIVQGFSLLSC